MVVKSIQSRTTICRVPTKQLPLVWMVLRRVQVQKIIFLFGRKVCTCYFVAGCGESGEHLLFREALCWPPAR